MSEQDDFPERFHRDRRQHGGASQYLDNDQDEQLARLTEEERAEFRREEDKGELGHINEHHPFPPTRYE